LTIYQYHKFPDLGSLTCIEISGEFPIRYYAPLKSSGKVVFLQKWEKGRLMDGVWVRGLDQVSSVLEELEFEAEVSRIASLTVVTDEDLEESEEDD